MQSLLLKLEDAFKHDQSVAFTSLVETRGSTPQKAGASMLVFPDLSQTGTLGGGCVEAEVKRRAIRLLDAGEREILTFHLDNNYGWDDGLICGGRMRMLVDPVRQGDDLTYFEVLHDILKRDRGCTEAVVIDAKKNEASTAGDRYLLDEKGKLLAARANGKTPSRLVTGLKPLSGRPRPYVVDGVSYLPHLRRCRLLIVGAGHVGQAVAQLAASVDFDVWVIDDREEYCSEERFPLACRRIVAPIDTALPGLDIDHDTFCIIVTRGHNHDEEALYHLAETPARYLGMIGSKRKIRLILEDLIREGISETSLRRVHSPLGFEIGSQSVPEIAISIVAELVAARNLEDFSDRYPSGSLLDTHFDEPCVPERPESP